MNEELIYQVLETVGEIPKGCEQHINKLLV